MVWVRYDLKIRYIYNCTVPILCISHINPLLPHVPHVILQVDAAADFKCIQFRNLRLIVDTPQVLALWHIAKSHFRAFHIGSDAQLRLLTVGVLATAHKPLEHGMGTIKVVESRWNKVKFPHVIGRVRIAGSIFSPITHRAGTKLGDEPIHSFSGFDCDGVLVEVPVIGIAIGVVAALFVVRLYVLRRRNAQRPQEVATAGSWTRHGQVAGAMTWALRFVVVPGRVFAGSGSNLQWFQCRELKLLSF